MYKMYGEIFSFSFIYKWYIEYLKLYDIISIIGSVYPKMTLKTKRKTKCEALEIPN